MKGRTGRSAPVLVVGGGIGGMAAALALSQQGFDVEVFEQSAEIGEIGAGLQLGPNGFAAMDALGVGERARGRAVFTDELVMMDAIDGGEVARIPVGHAFRQRLSHPCGVIPRAALHQSIYEEVQLASGIRIHTSARIAEIHVDDQGVRLVDAHGGIREGAAVVGCDGVHSVVRQRLIGDGHRVSGHVVYRALVNEVREGMIVCDIGAHVGLLALAAAKRVGPTGHVFAFEPAPKALATLQRHIRFNGYRDRAEAIGAVVSETDGVIPFYVYRDSMSNSLGRDNLDVLSPQRRTDPLLKAVETKVLSVTLDRFCKDREVEPDLRPVEFQQHLELPMHPERPTLQQRPSTLPH